MSPRVSVVVPVHDGERYLAETLSSILGQSVPPDEVIVVDDGSTDRSAHVAASFGRGIRVERVDVRHPERARSHGVAVASHDVVAFCDADDVWLPRKLERQLETASTLDLGRPMLVWTAFDEFVSPEIDPGVYRGRPPESSTTARLVSTLLTNRAALQTGRAPIGSAGTWIEWIAGLPDGTPDVRLGEVLMRRRLHLTNYSSRTMSREQSKSWLRAARQAVEQRRGGQS